jgi:hydrogenase maturation protease
MGPELASYASNATRVLLLDAMNSGSAPGTLARMTGRDLLAAKLGSSVHQLGLVDLIAALFLMSTQSQDIVVLGIQPANTDWGTVLSPQVEAALGDLVDAAVAQLQLWNEVPHTVAENRTASRPPMQTQNRRAGESPEKGAA